MFDGFRLDAIEVAKGSIRFRIGGSGPPLLLLHGHPRTHTTWHQVADLLREQHTIICPDLPGYGGSFKPSDLPDHANSSKRAKAQALIELMGKLGHDAFNVAGHDRGSYVAFRMAMDHPSRIRKLAVLDGVPIVEALERCRQEFAQRWWHWFFYAQPEKPERAIQADPLAWYGGSPATMGEENFADFARAISDPAAIHTMVEDYRAGLSVDVEHDRDDLSRGRKLQCPTLVLWSERDDLPDLYGDVVAVWRRWSDDLRGASISSGHHMAEETPSELALALDRFFRAA